MKGNLVYMTIAACLGIIASFYSISWQVMLLSFSFFVWIGCTRKNTLLFLCLVTFIFFFGYFLVVDDLNSSHLKKDDRILTGEIMSIPRFDGNKLSFRFKTVKNEIVQFSYRIKSEDELLQLKNIQVGSYCKVEGSLTIPQSATNYRAFDYRTYLYRQRIHWIFKPAQLSVTMCGNPNDFSLVRSLKRLRVEGIEFVGRIYPYSTSGIVQALLFGEQYQVSESTLKLYQSFGIIHLLAISGLHVGLIIGTFFYLGMRAGISRENVKSLCLFLLPLYIIITGASPSVVRACFMTMVVIISIKLRSKVHPLDSISISCIIILLYKPYFLFEAGFQLSFVVSYTLILSSEFILNRYASRVVQLLMVTIVAQLSSLPIILFHFFEVSLLSVLLNMIFVPFISLFVLPLSLFTTLLYLLFPNIKFFVILLVKAIESSINLLQWIEPFSVTLRLGKPSLWMVLTYYFAIVFLFQRFEKSTQLNQILCPSLFLFLVIGVHAFAPYLNPNGEVTMLDVGQGECIYIELPYRKAVYIIDTGGHVKFPTDKWQKSSKPFNIGEDVVLPFLKAKGIRNIDKLIFTHGDFDHIGGSRTIIESLNVRQIIVGEKEKYKDEAKEVLTDAYRKGITIINVRSGDHWKESGYFFYVLAPIGNEDSANNQSVVIFTELGGAKWLFTGDLEKNGEQQLLRKYSDITVDVLKVGHHGSETSSTEPFISAIKPQVALISAGKYNRFGHPHREVITRLDEHKVRVLRTDKNGSIRYVFTQKNGTFQWKIP